MGHWDATSAGPLKFEFTLEQAKHMFDSCQLSNEYHDIHAWKFTPSSFRLILRDLSHMGSIQLREKQFCDTAGFEFFTTLARSAPGCPLDRLSLSKAIVEEEKHVFVGPATDK